MSDDGIELTRRKILGSLGAVGATGAVAGFGTSALFSDEESFEDNTITAGQLDLKVDWEEHYSYPQLYGLGDPTTTPSGDLDVTRSEPGDTSMYVGLPDPENPVVWVHEDDLDAYMGNTAIEAFPDPDGDGEQEIETYAPCEDGADLPEDLSSDLRTTNAATADGDPLIKLEDVKPGDFGELTFSFHLCDNPGYVWLQAANVSESGGANPEPEQEAEGDADNDANLAENIETIWWYDARGDNVPPRTDCEEQLYLSNTLSDDTSPTELYEVELDDSGNEADLTELLPANDSTVDNGNFTQTDAIAATPNGSKIIFYDKVDDRLGEYDVAAETFTDVGTVGGPSGVVLAGYSPSGVLWAASQDTNDLYTVDISAPSATSQGDTGIELSGADLAFAADGTMYIWTSNSSINGLYKVDDPSSDTTAVPVDSSNIGTLDTDVTGMAIRNAGSGNIVVSDNADDEIIEIDRTDGSVVERYDMQESGSSFDHVFGDMTAGALCGEVFHRGTLKDDLDALANSPAPLDGNRASTFDEFGDPADSDDRECFPANITQYIGFAWWLPADVGNEVQGDSVSFDLGFYTEQCRNNDGSMGT
jgi:predicted ribosomally synthesized peptide with SipW-like signal peptide